MKRFNSLSWRFKIITEFERQLPAQMKKATYHLWTLKPKMITATLNLKPGYEFPAAGLTERKAHQPLSTFQKSQTSRRRSSLMQSSVLHSHLHHYPQSRYPTCIMDETHLLRYITDNWGCAAIPSDNMYSLCHLSLHIHTLNSFICQSHWPSDVPAE